MKKSSTSRSQNPPKINFPTDTNYAKAIEAYESTLNTPAAFDRYLGGQSDALTEKQKSGLRLFMSIGCADCHSGKLLGGERLAKFGVHQDYWMATGSKQPDAGLFESSNKEEDKNQFRVAMLRNIEKTGPYFHDGSVTGLDEAVRVMAKVQLDQELDDNQTQSIVAFLSSLTGEVPRNYTDPHRQVELSKDSKPSEKAWLTPKGKFPLNSSRRWAEGLGARSEFIRTKGPTVCADNHSTGRSTTKRLSDQQSSRQ